MNWSILFDRPLACTRRIVTSEAMGARCVVSAHFTGNGLKDLVSASSTDNQVAWYENKGGMIFEKHGITYASNGARIVTTGDVDGDGDMDIIVASYYDNTLRWFENLGPRIESPTNISIGLVRPSRAGSRPR